MLVCLLAYVRDTMGAVLSWFAIRICALMLHSGNALKRWRAQEALEDSPSLFEELVLEKGDFGAESLERCERRKGSGETFHEDFDTCLWHTNNLLDLIPDGEDWSFARTGGCLEDTYICQQTMGGSLCSGDSKARRRESVSARDSHRDVTESHVRPFICSRRKSPENCVEPNILLKLSNRDLCSVEIQPHPSTEKLKFDLHQEQGSLQAVVTDSTTPYNSHIQKQHKTSDAKVNTSDTQEVTLLEQSKENNPNQLNKDSETCVIHTDATEDNSVAMQ